MRVFWGAVLLAMGGGVVQPARAQVKPYTFSDIATLLEGGLASVRVIRRLETSCYDGPLGPPQLTRLRELGATPELLQALQSRACPKGDELPRPAAAPPPAPELRPLVVDPASPVMEEGTSLTLQPTVVEASGPRPPNVPLTWLSTDSAVVLVRGNRLLAMAPGEAVVVVRGAGLLAATVTVRVEPARAARLQVSVDRVSVPAGDSVVIDISAQSAGGRTVPTSAPDCLRVAACPRVEVSDTSIARVELRGTRRVLRTLRPGEIQLTAFLPSGVRQDARVRVTAPRIVSVRVQPETITLQPGGQQRLQWTAIGATGPIPPALLGAPQWVVSDERVALVQNGLLTALTDGQATVAVRLDGILSPAVPVTVQRPVRLAALLPSADTLRMDRGASASVTVRAEGSNGRPYRLTGITWVASDPAAVRLRETPSDDPSVASTVVVTSGQVGTFTVTAAASGVQSRPVVLVVTEPVAIPSALVADLPTLSLLVDSTRVVRVQATSRDGRVAPLAGLTWQSDQPARVTVRGLDPSGRAELRALAAGDARITATLPNGVTTSIAVQVTAPVVPVVVSYAMDTIRLAVGATTPLVIEAKRRDGAPFLGTWQVRWSASAPRLAAVQSEGVANGQARASVRALAPGQVVITGATDQGADARFVVVIADPEPVPFALVPNPATLVVPLDSSRTVRVDATTRDGRVAPLTGLTWQSDTPTRARVTAIDGEGRADVRGLSAGETQILASLPNGVSIRIPVRIMAPPAPAPAPVPVPVLLSYETDTIRIPVGAIDILFLEAKRADGSDFLGRWQVRWSSSAPRIASIEDDGITNGTAQAIVRAMAPGTVTITGATDLGSDARFVLVVEARSAKRADPAPLPRMADPAPSSVVRQEAPPPPARDTTPRPVTADEAPSEAAVRGFATSLAELLVARDSLQLAPVVAGTEVSQLTRLYRLLRSITSVPEASVVSVTRPDDGGTPSVSIRLSWRGAFGGESRLLVFDLAIDASGRGRAMLRR